MNRIATTTVAFLLIAAAAVPAAAAQSNSIEAPADATTCGGDYICLDPQAPLPAWVLDRLSAVRRQGEQARSNVLRSGEQASSLVRAVRQ